MLTHVWPLRASAASHPFPPTRTKLPVFTTTVGEMKVQKKWLFSTLLFSFPFLFFFFSTPLLQTLGLDFGFK